MNVHMWTYRRLVESGSMDLSPGNLRENNLTLHIHFFGSSGKASANAGDIRDLRSIFGSGRSLGEGNGNPFQYSCLEHCIYKGAWQAI